MEASFLNRTFSPKAFLPLGSSEEKESFEVLNRLLIQQFNDVWSNDLAPRTVVVIPSLTLDEQMSTKITGHHHYEERLLCLLMLLRKPRTQVIYVTSHAIDPIIIDYYLHLLPGIPSWHARQRLTLLHCNDTSPKSLTAKILERPRLIERICQAIPSTSSAHLTCFNATPLERALAVRLGIPLYAPDPDLAYWGTKSGSRKLFKEAAVPHPYGFEDLRDEKDILDALVALKNNHPALQKASIKLNEGFSGEGNAVFRFDTIPASSLGTTLQTTLATQIEFVDPTLTYDAFLERFAQMQGIVEEFIEGSDKASPSVQCRIDPLGRTDIISTHDQLLGGNAGQVFFGCTFPADDAYQTELCAMGESVAQKLVTKGGLGRFGIDFISVNTPLGWKHYAIEINLRKGGTTHPYLMLQFLTGGKYEHTKRCYLMPNGQIRYYFATDNLKDARYQGLTPQDLLEIMVFHGLQYDDATQEGVFFHLIGALSEHGKLGLTCIGTSPQRARIFYQKVIEVLNIETA